MIISLEPLTPRSKGSDYCNIANVHQYYNYITAGLVWGRECNNRVVSFVAKKEAALFDIFTLYSTFELVSLPTFRTWYIYRSPVCFV
jgi:hypothetical protein